MPERPQSTATLRLSAGDLRVVHDVTVPSDAVAAREVVPALQKLINAVVATAETMSADGGKPISCRKGCGACCRQLVPISRTEGERLADIVRALPAGRRARVEKRFEEAATRIERAGLWPTNGRSDREISLGYFALGVPCPFLEDESCSIHAERPLICREYLVTSPAELCAGPAQEGVTPVAVPKFSAAARKMQDEGDEWFPLALLTRQKKKAGETRPGTEWIQRFLKAFSKPTG